MLDQCQSSLTVASAWQELAFIEKALDDWETLNIAARQPAFQRLAAETVLGIYSAFMTDPQSTMIPFVVNADADRLRAVLAALVAVAAAVAKSGLAQAWVHAGLAHRHRIGFVWHPDRFARLSTFTNATIRSLDKRIMALDRAIGPTTLH